MSFPIRGEARGPGAVGNASGTAGGRLPGPIVVPAAARLGRFERFLEPASIVLGVLNGMDNQGEQILGTYLYGGGTDHDVRDDPMWTDYMKDHQVLAGQILIQLRSAVAEIAARKKIDRFPLSIRFHAEFPENSGFSGYALLHGSNRDRGGFSRDGMGRRPRGERSRRGRLRYRSGSPLRLQRRRRPERELLDRHGSRVRGQNRHVRQGGELSPVDRLGLACLAEVRPGKEIYFMGYPSAVPIGVRPLPEGKLDWVGNNRKYAQEIEDKIVEQLKRIISADRRHQPSRSEAAVAVAVLQSRQFLLWLDLSRSTGQPAWR